MNTKEHAFKKLSDEDMQSVLDCYIISRWSFSAISSFARNEKAFEKEYIYREKSKQSSASIGGSAYHAALEEFFIKFKEGKKLDLVDCEKIAFDYLDEIEASKWKIQKTLPTVEDCINQANKVAKECLTHFFEEMSVYMDDIDEILAVESYHDEFVTVNGVDVPLPWRGKIDLVFRSKSGKIVVLDHKSKKKFTDEKEVSFSMGQQGVLYAIGYESTTGTRVDEVWFAENKYSKNRDKSKQIRIHKIDMNDDTRRLYEAQVYEVIRRTLEATSNPDYIYLVNPSDNFIDQAELNEFWAKTMIAEVDDFNIPEEKRELVGKRLKKIRDASLANISPSVITKFKKNASAFITYDLSNKNMSVEEKIQHRLRNFGIPAQVSHKFEGYSSDTFLLEVQAGIQFSRIYKHRLDIANALGVSSVRMDQNLFVYEGKSYFVVESSKKREKDLLFDPKAQVDMKIPIGVTNFNETIYWDLDNPSSPHALVCGGTGSGKTEWMRSTIEYAKLAGITDIIIFDPKFDKGFKNVEGAEVINEAEQIEARMELLVAEMNSRVREGEEKMTLIIFDEFADSVTQSRAVYGKNSTLEKNLQMLLQKGRSCGFRIISATQRASTKIINGDAKVNFTVQICFRVQKAVDSIVVIDDEGAESLAGQGDGLVRSPDYQSIMRFQGYFLGKAAKNG